MSPPLIFNIWLCMWQYWQYCYVPWKVKSLPLKIFIFSHNNVMCWQKVRIIVLQVPPHPGCSRRAEQQRWEGARTGGSWWRVEGWLNWTELNWGDDGKSMKLVPSSRQCAHQINKLPTCSFVRVGSRYTCCINCINCIQSEWHLASVFRDRLYWYCMQIT